MDGPSALAAVLLAAAVALAGAGLVLHASASAADAACEADEDCYVSPGLGDAILAYRTFVAAILVGFAGVAALGYALLRPRPKPAP